MTKRIVVFVLALACATPALAQVSTPTSAQSSTPYSSQSSTPPDPLHHREWEGTFYAGYAFLKDYKFRTIVYGSDEESPGVVGVHYQSGYRLGARATQNLGDFFAATVEYGVADQAMRLTNVAPRASSLELGHFVHSLTYNVAVSPMARDERFRPYIEAGLGALLFHITKDSKERALSRGVALEDSWEVLFTAGIGFKYLIADRFALTADVKGRISDIPTYGLAKTTRLVNGQYQPAISASGLMRSWQVNLGIAHQWDAW